MSKNVIRLMILSLLLHVAPSYLAVAQEMATVEDEGANIGNVQLRRDGNVLIVEYDLNLGKNVSSCKVDISLSLDGGESFAYRPTDIGQYLSGDVGKVSGSGKKIIYFSLNERMEKVMSDKEMEILLSVYDKKIKKGKSFAPLTDSQQKRKWKYLSNVELNTSIDVYDTSNLLSGLGYIGGLEYRDRYFFGIGVGLSYCYDGLDIAFPANSILVKDCYSKYDKISFHAVSGTMSELPRRGYNLLHVPLYLHCKGRFLKSKCSPYAALSLGGRFSSAYRQSVFAETSVGVSYKMSDSCEMYLSVGVCFDPNMQWHDYVRASPSEGYSDFIACPYCNDLIKHTHIIEFYNMAVPIIVRLGFSF